MEVIYKPLESTSTHMCIELIDQDFHLTQPQASILCTKQDDGLYQLSQLYVLPQFQKKSITQNKPITYEEKLLQEAINFCKTQHASRVIIKKIPTFTDPLLPIKLLQKPKTVLALVQHLTHDTTLEFEESYQEWPPIHVANILYKKEGTVVAKGLCDWNIHQKRHFFDLYVKPKFRGNQYGVPIFLGAQQIMSQLSQEKSMKFLAEPFEYELLGGCKKIQDKEIFEKLVSWYTKLDSKILHRYTDSADMECPLGVNRLSEPLSWEIILKKSLFTHLFG